MWNVLTEFRYSPTGLTPAGQQIVAQVEALALPIGPLITPANGDPTTLLFDMTHQACLAPFQ
jgi:hypothetical protein